jgi:hypothetical protein
MTLYYIGETLDGMRAAVEKFDLPRTPVKAPILGAQNRAPNAPPNGRKPDKKRANP